MAEDSDDCNCSALRVVVSYDVSRALDQHYPETMFAVTLHLLLIGSLLTCPLRCMAWHSAPSEAAPSVQLESEQSDCGCCASSQQASLPSSPPSSCPEGHCDCGDCLCHGAVVEDGTSLHLPTVISLADLPPVLDEQIAARPTGLIHALDETSPGGSLPNGRSRRVAHQSWLI